MYSVSRKNHGGKMMGSGILLYSRQHQPQAPALSFGWRLWLVAGASLGLQLGLKGSLKNVRKRNVLFAKAGQTGQ